VIQVYVGPAVADTATADASRPRRWLAGFASVTADPDGSQTVRIDLPARTWQVWDGGWSTVAGEYTIQAAHSIDDVRLTTTIVIG
jgi:beta-glucosidase